MALPNIIGVCQVWKDFQFSELQQDLDNEASSIALRQDQSEISRKALVEQSKEFKHVASEETRKSVSTLLKSFQVEVDSLSKRSKKAEAAFLSVYKKLIDVPDPWPALEQTQNLQKKISKQMDTELEVKQLRDTLEEYNKEFVDVKNQDVTIKQLKEKIRTLEENSDSYLEDKTKAKEKELKLKYSEKEDKLEEEKIRVAAKLGVAEQEVSSLQNALTVSQSEVLEFKAISDYISNAKTSENDLVLQDCERLIERAMTAEGQVIVLQAQIEELQKTLVESGKRRGSFASVDSNSDSQIEALSRSGLEVELSAKQKEVDQLVEDVQRLQSALHKCKDFEDNQVQALEESLAESKQEIERLHEELSLKSDYDEMKRELIILKSMEAASDVEGIAGGNGDENKDFLKQTLEVLLLTRNRALMNENTQLKLANSNMKDCILKLDKEKVVFEKQILEQKTLLIQLEEDLLHVETVSSLVRSEGEGSASPPLPVSTVHSMKPFTSSSDSVNVDMPIDGSEAHVNNTETLESFTSSTSQNPSDSLLAIVSSQRERFRLRTQELETESISYKNRVQTLQGDVDKLRGDNIKLYEKIKFLQATYSSGTSGVRPSGSRQNLTDATESRYAGEYELSLDPFQSFARKERSRTYANLKPYEKVTLHMVRFILGSPISRTFAFFYSVFLHLLVFLVLYRFSLVEECIKDTAEDCAHKFADHMLHVHGDKHV